MVQGASWLRNRDDSLVSWLMFLVPLGLLIARRLLAWTSYNVYISEFCSVDQVRYIAIAIIGIREILFGRYDARSLAGLVVFASLGAIAFAVDYRALVDVTVFVFAARNMRFDVIAKFTLATLSALMLFVFASVGLGLIPDVVFSDPGPLGGRHTLGLAR